MANAISPLLNVFELYLQNVDYAFFLGAMGMSLGLFLFGHRVLEMVGKKIQVLDFQKSFCVQFSSSIAIMLGSYFGYPLSSTHCNIGSLFGLMAAENFGWFRDIYETSLDHRKNKMHLQVVLKLAVCWIMTVPIAALITFGLSEIFKHVY